ncbi:phage tail-collar fiber domain-containing protein [Aeromonas veronii]|uniref:phage tail-collar fiber domain-containing protein n=1 Tax=Aeromonas veronii TaxID=654 RepID=UPI0024857198|nr:phage tail protein [Aeromonas veronii]
MADFRGYVTAAGQTFEALAKQMGYPVTIGFIEVGDGKLPDSESPIDRTQLVHKLKQFPAIVEQDAKNPGQWVATCYIPADDAINGAGYFIREIGCKLINQGNGVLYAYRRVSDDWKPVITSGEAKSFIYKLRFIPSNGELLTPTIDPSVVLVDKEELARVMKAHVESRNHPDATEDDKGFSRHAKQSEVDDKESSLGNKSVITVEKLWQWSSRNGAKIAPLFSLWSRSVAEAGYQLVGAFGSEALLENKKHVLLDESGTSVYLWGGEFPKLVGRSEKPSDINWVDISSRLLSVKLSSPGGAGEVCDTLKPVTWQGFLGGADKTGAKDSKSQLDLVYESADKDGTSIIIPKGTYKVGQEIRKVGSDTIWLSRGFDSGVSPTQSAMKTPFLITIGTPDEEVMSAEHTRVGLNITAIARGAQHADCIRASLINKSTDGKGNTSVYGSAASTPYAMWSAALHGETKHDGGTSIAISSESASYTINGTFYGAVINNTTGTADEVHPVTGAIVAEHPTATALYITGGDTRGKKGQWQRGIRFSPLSMRDTATLIRDESKAAQGYWSLPSSEKTVADIFLEGKAPQGIIIQGTYETGNAIRIADGLAIAYEATGKIKTKYSKADMQWGLYHGDTQRAGFGTASFGLFFNGQKVVGERVSGLQSMTGVSDGSTKNTEEISTAQLARYVKWMSDALKQHGLF